MSEQQQQIERPPPDDGLKRLLTYTLIALVLSVLAAFVAVGLVIRFFEAG